MQPIEFIVDPNVGLNNYAVVSQVNNIQKYTKIYTEMNFCPLVSRFPVQSLICGFVCFDCPDPSIHVVLF